MISQGILFIASGEKYVQAAIRSAHSVLKYCPDLASHLFTDAPGFESHFMQTTFPFTAVQVMENPHERSKVDYMALSPFNQTLYLDTDTLLHTDIRGMFQILERFDIALAHAMRRMAGNLKPWRIPLPHSFPEFNSGVVLFRKTPAVIKFLGEWGGHFRGDWQEVGRQSGTLSHDQTTLRELLWLSDLRIATLPPEYNVRFIKYHFLWSKTEAETKIFHLKALHIGWWPWFNRKIRATRVARKLGLGWLVNLIKKDIRTGRK